MSGGDGTDAPYGAGTGGRDRRRAPGQAPRLP
ncbi:hypothetical protein GA0115240_12601, partial [Streptomyces sp. DvalAA-14]